MFCCSPQTVEFLKRCKLNIGQMPSEDFQLTKEVVCRQFLKQVRGDDGVFSRL